MVAVLCLCRYRSKGHTADEKLTHTFYLLHDLMIFFDHYHTRKIDVALEVCGCCQLFGIGSYPPFFPIVTHSFFLPLPFSLHLPPSFFPFLGQIMKKLRLLPLAHGESVEQKVAAFRTMDDAVNNLVFCVGVSKTLRVLYSLYAYSTYINSFVLIIQQANLIHVMNYSSITV